MPAKWFCNECSKEIWKELREYIKKQDTVKALENRCFCSNCMIKKYKKD